MRAQNFLFSEHRSISLQQLYPSGLQSGVRVENFGVGENILLQSKRNTGTCLNLQPALILALTKIRPGIEVLACQKQAQSSH
jgi:hypothetical protein